MNQIFFGRIETVIVTSREGMVLAPFSYPKKKEVPTNSESLASRVRKTGKGNRYHKP